MAKTKTVAEKKITKKVTSKKAPAKKTVAKKAPAKKTVAKKAPAKKTVAKKAPQKIANNKSKIAPYKSKKNEKYMSAAMLVPAYRPQEALHHTKASSIQL